jgi:hypothetical protein
MLWYVCKWDSEKRDWVKASSALPRFLAIAKTYFMSEDNDSIRLYVAKDWDQWETENK